MTERTENQIETYVPSAGHLGDLRERCRLAINHDHSAVEIGTEDLMWLLLLVPPPANGHAVIYWDADGFYWTPADSGQAGQGPHVELDEAIVAAQAAGFKIFRVSMTRGHIPSLGTMSSRQALP